ncbi:hypothetical protein RND71_015729 [Anisodus tanguticus]|uniref:Uncharacterized protein n=1 Tax=Anisodus tanguticus TaxID=243964 RepID=A0AAE1S8H1_9SOLA|nr:hypothetical protein RND71_015729 [Anisodus tanguticus]
MVFPEMARALISLSSSHQTPPYPNTPRREISTQIRSPTSDPIRVLGFRVLL